MTTVYRRPPEEAIAGAAHAFVIGVGDYPFAKTEMGTNPTLRGVRDLPSAADGAKLVCEWLIANKDRLIPRLGSIELLVSDVPGGAPRYTPADPARFANVDRADAEHIFSAGEAWLGRLQEDPGSTALFYACGHGANYSTQTVLFHSDLNRRAAGSAWSHLNVGVMAQAFRQLPEVNAAFFFLDACGEFVKDFPAGVRDDGFISPQLISPADRDKVWLLAAASSGTLAYPGAAPADAAFEAPAGLSGVKIGRFTQTLLKGLDGASARWAAAGWSVDSMGLWADLRQLHRVYFPNWSDKPFEPSQVMTPNSRIPIIAHSRPRLPVLVTTDPADRADRFDLGLGLAMDGTPPLLDSRGSRSADAWLGHVEGDITRPVYALAVGDGGICHSSFFKADQPQFDQRVPVA